MMVIYREIMSLALAAPALGALLLWVPHRQDRDDFRYSGTHDGTRLAGALAEALMGRLAMVPAVVLPLLGAALVVLAFVHGELSDVTEGWWYALDPRGHILEPWKWALRLVYCGIGALVVAGCGFVARPRGRPAVPQASVLLGIPDSRLDWPWRSFGGPRQWAAYSCAVGSWLLTGCVVLMVPTLLNLMVAVLGAQETAATVEAITNVVSNQE
ncbi:hypothetical protein [Candidatus Poriferisodalis sp.]|uniref:hypothetical protein n=1 Tax=Candidatus Poriferisodalis sp. TaxID=3101277 RepID=UPI003B5257C9